MKKFVSFLLALVMCLFVAACGNGETAKDPPDNTGGTEQNGGGQNSGSQDDPGDNDTDPGINTEDINVADKLNKLVKSFWSGDTMYDETVLLVAETDASGNVVSAPKAKLMFAPTEIVEVKQYNISTKLPEKIHAETSYKIEDGYLVATGENTELPYVTDKAISGEQPFPGVPQNAMIPSTDTGLYLPFCEDGGIIKKQLYVTYKHAPVSTDTLPEFAGNNLPHAITKLVNKEDLELFIYGDSISTGANSSGYLELEPNLDPWFRLVRKNLENCYGGKVTLKNYSVGGWTSKQGVDGGPNGGKTQLGLAALFKDQNNLKGYKPDLAIIGFGMNDATLNVGIANYKENITSIIDTIRKQNADCDIILLGTMLANPKAKDQCKNQTEYSQSLNSVADGYKGVTVVDVGKVHRAILDSGKLYTEISANNVNHPNDFTTRMYAMAILNALVK